MTWNHVPRVVTSNKFRPAPSNKLENLMGFFSILGATAGAAPDGVGIPVEAMAERRMVGWMA